MSLLHSLKWLQLFLSLGHGSPILGMIGTKADFRHSQLSFDVGFVARLRVRRDALQNCPPLRCRFFWFLTLKRTYGPSFISFGLNLNRLLLALGLTVLQVSQSCSLCLSGKEGASTAGLPGGGRGVWGPPAELESVGSSHVPEGCTRTPDGQEGHRCMWVGLANACWIYTFPVWRVGFPWQIFNLEKGELLWKWVGFGAASSWFQLMWAQEIGIDFNPQQNLEKVCCWNILSFISKSNQNDFLIAHWFWITWMFQGYILAALGQGAGCRTIFMDGTGLNFLTHLADPW